MKTPQKLLLAFAFSTLVAGAASAQIASDNAGNAAYSGGNWTTGSNGGSGFGAWTLTPIGAAGSYIGQTGLGNGTFGLYSNGSGNSSTALRPFDAPLASGQTISFSVGNSQTINGEIGFSFWNTGNSTSSLTFKFVGGGGNWTMNDGGSDFPTGQAYASGTPLNFSLTYNGGQSYSYVFGTGSGENYTASALISSLSSVSFYSSNQGADQNFGFNNLSVVPEPSTYALIALGAAFVLWRVRRRVTSGA